MKHHHLAGLIILGVVLGLVGSLALLHAAYTPYFPMAATAISGPSNALPPVVPPQLNTTTTPLSPTPENPNVYTSFYNELQNEKSVNSSTIGIQFFGDIMLDRNVAKAMGTEGTSYLFKNIMGPGNGLDNRIDLTVANLEGPFAPTRIPTTKSIAFRFDPKYAAELAQAGFDIVSLANNHSLDMGWKNVDFTHTTLDQAGLGHFGDQLRETTEFTYIINAHGSTIAFVGFNNTDHVMDLKKVSRILADANSRASTTIVMMHWGTEYQRSSNKNQQTFAHFLIDQGADAVIGAHPHVIEEAEIYQDKPIFYSLGNFVFDQYFSTDTQEGLSLGLIIQDAAIKSIYAFPIFGIKSQVNLMDGQRRDDFYAWLNKNSRLGTKSFIEGRLDLRTRF
jgi:poly-gamma-glutamate synthesis protein (capsule biosynthesis protein)